MSYARFDSGSDIYLYGSGAHSWTCCMCKLQKKDNTGFHGDTIMQSLQEVVDHLEEHTRCGHLVHESCTIRVKRELDAQQVPLQEFTEEVFQPRKVSLKRKK